MSGLCRIWTGAGAPQLEGAVARACSWLQGDKPAGRRWLSARVHARRRATRRRPRLAVRSGLHCRARPIKHALISRHSRTAARCTLSARPDAAATRASRASASQPQARCLLRRCAIAKHVLEGSFFMYFVILWRKGIAPTAPADDATHAWRRVSVPKPPGKLPRFTNLGGEWAPSNTLYAYRVSTGIVCACPPLSAHAHRGHGNRGSPHLAPGETLRSGYPPLRRCGFPGVSPALGSSRIHARRSGDGRGDSARVRGAVRSDATAQQKGDTEQSVAGRVHCSRLCLFVGFQHHCEGGYVYWDRSADIPQCVTAINVRADIE